MTPVRLEKNTVAIGSQSYQKDNINKQTEKNSFSTTLKNELVKQNDVKISAHAQKRLADRSVELNQQHRARLNDACSRITNKGADKALVMMDDLALVVSARNRVVITALDANSARDGVFTNIEGAVIA
ncbi:MAG: TIGR02530 family flagellar biosynthesis protein [Armatimonadota bacterium]